MTHRGRNRMLHWLGAALTLTVLGLDLLGLFGGLERWFYDRRARYCQTFTPPPTSRLVHLDIDESSLETVGAWPWPRTTMATVVDEIRLAGAKVLALDILYAEPKPAEDAELARALKSFGLALAPTSFNYDLPADASPLRDAAAKALTQDLRLTPAQLAERLQMPAARLSEQDYLAALHAALDARVTAARRRHRGDAEMLRSTLAAKLGDALNDLTIRREFDRACRRHEADRAIQSKAILPFPELTSVLQAAEPRSAAPALVGAGSLGGFVDVLTPEAAGAVRSVPLWIQYRGRLYPQMALAMACATLGVNPADTRLTEDSMILPRPGGRELVVPLRTAQTHNHGGVAAFVDIPWFGGSDWQTMYDYPRHAQPRQHVPIHLVWAVADARPHIAQNNREAERALQFFVDYGFTSAKTFLQRLPPLDQMAARTAGLESVLAEADSLGGIEPFAQIKPQDLKPDEAAFVEHYNELKRVVSANKQFQRKATNLRHLLADKTVLIGWAATGAMDQWPTPLHGQCPGPVVHGAIFNALMTGDFWRTAPYWVTGSVIGAIGLLTTLAVNHLSPTRAMIASSLLVSGYLALNALTIFDYGNWIVGAAGPGMAGVVVWSGLTLTRFVGETAERNRITRRFSSYADPNLVQYVLEHPELDSLEGQVQELSVVFTDLAGFTTLTEMLQEKAVPVLGDYLNRMVPLIQERRGYVNKFLGDGIMFFYGAPFPNVDHAADAVATVLKMHTIVAAYNVELAMKNLPRVSMRAGISTGPMVVGDCGSHLRSDYTVIGDEVNLSARLESANKVFHTRTLITARTAELLGGRFLLRPVGRLQVKGKTQGVMTYEPLAKTDEATAAERRLAELSANVVNAFIAGDFAACKQAAEAMTAELGESHLAGIYKDLAESYLAEPPTNFAGVVVLKDK